MNIFLLIQVIIALGIDVKSSLLELQQSGPKDLYDLHSMVADIAGNSVAAIKI